jgi:RluA family pseudouridine synthase
VKPEVLHKDELLLVVGKPAGVLSVPGRGEAPALTDLLREMGVVASGEPLLMVHRLDRGASGVMVLARSTLAQQRLTEQWHARRVEKVYWALVQGYVQELSGEIDKPLWIDRDKRKVRVNKKHGKAAVTRYRVLERFSDHTLLECTPLTGRLHQIRVHMAHIGHPLAVDARYGGGKALMLSSVKRDYRPSARHEERPLVARLTLHALRLTFIHPRDWNGADSPTVTPATFEASLPKDFRATLNQLRRI